MREFKKGFENKKGRNIKNDICRLHYFVFLSFVIPDCSLKASVVGNLFKKHELILCLHYYKQKAGGFVYRGY